MPEVAIPDIALRFWGNLAILYEETLDASTSLLWRLFVNDFTPGFGTVRADFVEPVGAWYPNPLFNPFVKTERSSYKLVTLQDHVRSYSFANNAGTEKSFVLWQNITGNHEFFGVWCTDSFNILGDNQVRACRRFPDAPIVRGPGSSLSVELTFTIRSEEY